MDSEWKVIMLAALVVSCLIIPLLDWSQIRMYLSGLVKRKRKPP